MKGYGLPRYSDCEFPDKSDVKLCGRKSSVMRKKGKGGKIRSHIDSDSKKISRRIWKKKERHSWKNDIESGSWQQQDNFDDIDDIDKDVL